MKVWDNVTGNKPQESVYSGHISWDVPYDKTLPFDPSENIIKLIVNNLYSLAFSTCPFAWLVDETCSYPPLNIVLIDRTEWL